MILATENEAKVLRSIATNSYCDANYRSPRTYQAPDVWMDCINDSGLPSGIEGKALSGVCSSLSKKGFASFSSGKDGSALLLQAGWDAMIAFYGDWEACFSSNPMGVA